MAPKQVQPVLAACMGARRYDLKGQHQTAASDSEQEDARPKPPPVGVKRQRSKDSNVGASVEWEGCEGCEGVEGLENSLLLWQWVGGQAEEARSLS